MSISSALTPYQEQIISCGFIACDIEYHLLRAYNDCYKSHHTTVPEFMDISDLFDDSLDDTGVRWLDITYYSYKIHRRELTMELVEEVLCSMKAEFITMMGEHVNECQNIIIEEMI